MRNAILLLTISALVLGSVGCGTGETVPTDIQGTTMGRVPYQVKYFGGAGVEKAEIDAVLNDLLASLSTYDPESLISTFNDPATMSIEADEHFRAVLTSAFEVYEATDGAFDPTVGPLVNYWGFGPDERPASPDSAVVDSLLQLVGMDKIEWNPETGIVRKTVEGMELDFSAIAKGYAVDEVAELLESKGIEAYYVNIGGEMRGKGRKPDSSFWSLGVEEPEENLTPGANNIVQILSVQDESVATSGNYRNYYKIDGVTYSHTISPRTGYPVRSRLLSATVYRTDCMTADAYATAFMVLGTEESIKVAERNDVRYYFIGSTPDGSYKHIVSESLQERIVE